MTGRFQFSLRALLCTTFGFAVAAFGMTGGGKLSEAPLAQLIAPAITFAIVGFGAGSLLWVEA